MTGEEEDPQISASAFGNPEFEELKTLPADKRRALVEELRMMARESSEVAQAAQMLMEVLDPGEGEE